MKLDLYNYMVLQTCLDGAEVSASGWGSGGLRFQSHPRLTCQSCSRYQLNQLESNAASEIRIDLRTETDRQSSTCGLSNARLWNCFIYPNPQLLNKWTLRIHMNLKSGLGRGWRGARSLLPMYVATPLIKQYIPHLIIIYSTVNNPLRKFFSHWESQWDCSKIKVSMRFRARNSLRIKNLNQNFIENLIKTLIKNLDLGQDLIEILNKDFFLLMRFLMGFLTFDEVFGPARSNVLPGPARCN